MTDMLDINPVIANRYSLEGHRNGDSKVYFYGEYFYIKDIIDTIGMVLSRNDYFEVWTLKPRKLVFITKYKLNSYYICSLAPEGISSDYLCRLLKFSGHEHPNREVLNSLNTGKIVLGRGLKFFCNPKYEVGR